MHNSLKHCLHNRFDHDNQLIFEAIHVLRVFHVELKRREDRTCQANEGKLVRSTRKASEGKL